jgi:hypothetical protein
VLVVLFARIFIETFLIVVVNVKIKTLGFQADQYCARKLTPRRNERGYRYFSIFQHLLPHGRYDSYLLPLFSQVMPVGAEHGYLLHKEPLRRGGGGGGAD